MDCWVAPSFFRVHIISQRWQPEQRARSVTIIFVGVVRSSMRPEAMEAVVTPQEGEHAADHQAGNAATGHGEHGATGKEGLLLLGGRRRAGLGSGHRGRGRLLGGHGFIFLGVRHLNSPL